MRIALLFAVSVSFGAAAADTPQEWRADKRLIDMHQHIDYTTQHLARAVKIMDSVGIGVEVNLSGGTVTRRTSDAPSEFERNKALADRLYPGRFLHYFNLDYKGWDEPDFSDRAAKQGEDAVLIGAAGKKEFKRLGRYLGDDKGQL